MSWGPSAGLLACAGWKNLLIREHGKGPLSRPQGPLAKSFSFRGQRKISVPSLKRLKISELPLARQNGNVQRSCFYKRQLSEANGSFQSLLKGLDMDKLDVAIRAVKNLVKILQEVPAGGQEGQAAVSAEVVQAMIAHCDRIADLVDEIYGRLKYLKVEEVQ